MAQRAVPAPFLTKTYQLVDDRSTDEVISWNESGTTFVVWKTADFARDLLPKYFKHNNFSSFVRQLNTYGFRKIVPDKWEFANDNFRRAHKELLSEIRRRKIATPAPGQTSPTEKSAGGNANSSTSHSGDDLGSTSTSSPESKNPGSVDTAAIQFADISGENEKLKKDNEMLSSELAQAKKQCDELIGFLTEYMKVGPDQIERIMRQVSNCGPIRDGSASGAVVGDEENKDDSECRGDDDDENGNGGESLKLFGVLLKCGHNNKKRARDEQIGFAASRAKEIRICNKVSRISTCSY